MNKLAFRYNKFLQELLQEVAPEIPYLVLWTYGIGLGFVMGCLSGMFITLFYLI